MVCIELKVSKKGNEFFVLTINDVFVSFDRVAIEKVAKSSGVSIRDIYSLSPGERIILDI